MSRPTKLTPEIIEQICLFIENGNTNKDACYMAGISEAIFYLWLQKAKKLKKKSKANAIYFELLESIKKAESKFRAYHISIINTSAKRNWQASAWMLERRYPSEYGRRVTELQVGGIEETAIPIKIYLPDNGRDKTTA